MFVYNLILKFERIVYVCTIDCKTKLKFTEMTKPLSFLLVIMLVGMTVFSKNQKDKSFKPKEIKKAMTTAAMWQLANPKHKL